MKKRTVIGVLLIAGAILTIMGILMVKDMFKTQYNSNGVSHYLVITIDKNQSKEYVGTLENRKVYIEGLNLKETNFRTVKAKDLSVEKAIEKELVTINDFKKYAFKTIKKGNTTIFRYDNYEIAITSSEIVIRPISK